MKILKPSLQTNCCGYIIVVRAPSSFIYCFGTGYVSGGICNEYAVGALVIDVLGLSVVRRWGGKVSGSKYKHSEEIHGRHAADSLVQVMFDLLRPASVVDFGCGTGNFLAAFRDLGVEVLKGYDGPWVPLELRAKNITTAEFVECDFTEPMEIGSKYDLALCLEVAEHIPEKHAESLISTILTAADTVVFSAAIPGQDGDGHINCQWPEYWASKFRIRGFETFDLIRPRVCRHHEIPWWYRQNVFVASRLDLSSFGVAGGCVRNRVEPECYESLLSRYNSLALASVGFLWRKRSISFLRAVGRKIVHVTSPLR